MPTLTDFAGDWRLARTIDDRRAARLGRFDGRATLRPDGEGLLYEEEGLLALDGSPPLRASRAYLWRADGDGIAVRFADGRPFHRLVPRGEGAGTDHPCGADLYRVRYDFRAWPAWSVEWEVRGPAKDYRMASRYARA